MIKRHLRALATLTAAVGGMAGMGLNGQARAESSGADVIVGELHNNITYMIDQVDINNGLGNRKPYSIGTVSCNRGDVPFSWRTSYLEEENRHPVIGQNLFRIADGRIEQIGQAWLKHGYTALQGSECAGDPGFPHAQCFNDPRDGTYLGVGCSDPYDASLNGQQTALGPKWQVDAARGLFPFPYDDPDHNGEVPRRLSVDTAKLTNASAVYITEGQYVGFDDAASGHDNNNASWRRVDIQSASPWEMTPFVYLSTTTQREQPAIYAWRAHANGVDWPDNTITISPLDVPGDGRLIMGVRVTQINASTWRYTYAVQNLNSHRSGRSITIPFPGGTTISNLFYNEPGYHSGEPNENQPAWSVTQNATSITWAGPAHTGAEPIYTLENNPTDPGHVIGFTPGTGNDHSANALRWGTMYTFGFDANAAPAMGSVSMELFRPSSPASTPTNVVWSVRTPGGSVVGTAPGNDSCASAYAIIAEATAFSTAGATTDGPVACDAAQLERDVWFLFAAQCSGQITVNTCGSDYNTKLGVYPAGQCPPTQGSLIACNDNHAGGGCANATDSSLTFNAVEGQSYLIRVGSPAGGAGGNGLLTVISCPFTGACCTLAGVCAVTTADLCDATFLGAGSSCFPVSPCQVTAPGNDLCENAQDLCDAQTVLGSTANADSDGAATCGNSSNSASVWYTYTPALSGSVTISLCDEDHTTYDTAISLWSGNCPGVTQIACDDDGCGGVGGSSSITTNLTAGTRYLIRVAGYNREEGDFAITVTGGGGMGCTTVINDNCQGRIGIGTGTIPFTTVDTNTDGPAHADCSVYSYPQIAHDIWYNFPLAVDGTLSVDTCGADFDTKIAIYETTNAQCSSINDTTLVGCNDDSNVCGNGSSQSALTVNTTAGLYYIIRVGGYENQSGTGELHVSIQSGNQTGACCVGHVCSITTLAGCTGSFKGLGTVCDASPSNPVICCPANFNSVNGVTVQDIFDFLTAWLAGSVNADFNAVNGVTVQDIFDFLTAWLAGC